MAASPGVLVSRSSGGPGSGIPGLAEEDSARQSFGAADVGSAIVHEDIAAAPFQEVALGEIVLWSVGERGRDTLKTGSVLVQREMEVWRSPLVSIARVSAGRGAADRNGDRHEESGTEAAISFKR